ncbi:Uncharacterised protein [Mesomycoplasma conjunctivae]|uniref:Uncharacterized protein n=1 Tax=Mesomycoplasma conjunctivae (strain ATCC 25834 / NCTC 10147 / HRC/581) TaxID=572263 RepID=C5J6W0_MESCH|nr:P110/LppT family adhesin N-terminal domain [Mesomycoplasma conjunctivae]CAT05223.1 HYPOTHETICAL PROTEIN MCJ_005240 [Mesomycoplasma conjunctivae]VEU66443.1 Uncharacterised protein [Mesomycoplasma conjunctivae]
MKKTTIKRKQSNARPLLILASGLIFAGIVITGSYFAYKSFLKQRSDLLDESQNVVQELNQEGIKISNEDFAKEIADLKIIDDYKKYSAFQVLNLAKNPTFTFKLIDLFNLSEVNKKYPNLKIIANVLNQSDVTNASQTTRVEDNKIVNVLFTAHDFQSRKTYNLVSNIEGFEGQSDQDASFNNFIVDEEKSSFSIRQENFDKLASAQFFIDDINNYYQNTANQNALQTINKFGVIKLVDQNGNFINFPQLTSLDFAKDENGKIKFKDFSQEDGSISLQFVLLDSNKKQITSFYLPVNNLVSYKQATKQFANLLNGLDRKILKLKPEKQAEITLSRMSISEFFRNKRDISDFFDFSELQKYFNGLDPKFEVSVKTTNLSLDKKSEIELSVNVIYDNQEDANLQQGAQTLQAEISNPKPLYQFDFIFKVFENFTQDYLDIVVGNNDFFIVKSDKSHIDGQDIINSLKNINAAFYSYVENKSINKGYEVINLEDNSTYDTLSSQSAIIFWIKKIFADTLILPFNKQQKPSSSDADSATTSSTSQGAPSTTSQDTTSAGQSQTQGTPTSGDSQAQTTTPTAPAQSSQQNNTSDATNSQSSNTLAQQAVNEKPEEILAQIFSRLNNIINQKQLKNNVVRYKLNFDNTSHKLTIAITIVNEDNEIVASRDITIIGFASSSEALYSAKANNAKVFFEAASGLEYKQDGNTFRSDLQQVSALRSIINPNAQFVNSESNQAINFIHTPLVSGVSLDGIQLVLQNKSATKDKENSFDYGSAASFALAFSQKNDLQAGKAKIILSSEQKGVQPNKTNSIFIQKLAKGTTIEANSQNELQKFAALKSESGTTSQDLWVIGLTSETVGENILMNKLFDPAQQDKVQILGIYPVSQDTNDYTTFIISNQIDAKSNKVIVETAAISNNKVEKEKLEISSTSSSTSTPTVTITQSQTTSNPFPAILLGSKNNKDSETIFRSLSIFDKSESQSEGKSLFDSLIETYSK